MLLSHQKPQFSCQTLLSLVTISTLTVWSKAPQTHSPFLSGLQSRLEIGCVDRVTFCKRLTEPATPISAPSESFFERWAGYSLAERKVKRALRVCWDKQQYRSALKRPLRKVSAVLKANVFKMMSHHIQVEPRCVFVKYLIAKQWDRSFESWYFSPIAFYLSTVMLLPQANSSTSAAPPETWCIYFTAFRMTELFCYVVWEDAKNHWKSRLSIFF